MFGIIKSKGFWSAIAAAFLGIFGGIGSTFYLQATAEKGVLKAVLSDKLQLPDDSAFMQILHVRNIGKKEFLYVAIHVKHQQTIQPVDFRCASIAKNTDSSRSPLQLRLRYENLPARSGITCIFLTSLKALKISPDDIQIATHQGTFDSNNIRREAYQ